MAKKVSDDAGKKETGVFTFFDAAPVGVAVETKDSVTFNSDHTESISHPHAHTEDGYTHSHTHSHVAGKPSHDNAKHFQDYGYYHDVTVTASKEMGEGEKEARSKMPEADFAYVDSKGEKHLPINDAAHVRNALARFNQTAFEDKAAKKSAMAKIRAAAKKFGVDVGEGKKEFKQAALREKEALPVMLSEVVAKEKRPGSTAFGLAYQQKDGRLRWYARYSNAFEDRDGEIATEAGHKDFIEWADTNKAYPELWLWHTPGTRIGEADWLEFSDGFAHASGLIDKGKEAAAEKLKELGPLGVSHGFLTPASNGTKYIDQYRTFEISPLPLDRAAVWTTDFSITGKETDMAFSAEKRKFLAEVLGEEPVAELEKSTEKTAAALKQLGVDYKERAASAGAPVTPAAEPPAAPTPPAAPELTVVEKALLERVEQLTQQVKELQKTDDEKVADDWAVRAAKAMAGAGTLRPTESTSTLVTKEEADKIGQPGAGDAEGGDYFSNMVLKSFQGAAAGVGAPTNGLVNIK